MSSSASRQGGRATASIITFLLFNFFALCFSSDPASPSSAMLETRSQLPFLTPEATSDTHDAFSLQRVNVTLAVMSRCPDALACEAAFDKVLDRVNAKTRLTMSYIGSIDKGKQHSKYGASCMHGDQECAGNVQQLCVQDALNPIRAGEDYDLSPSAAQKKWWNFLQCQNFAGLSKVGNEDLAQRCLRVVDGPSWDKDGIAKCVHGKRGRKLLQRSIKASKQANLVTSCTILFESGKKCIRDGGAWKDCDLGHEPADFIAEIERIWAQKNHGAEANTVPVSSKTQIQALPATKLVKRQSSPSSTDSGGMSNPFSGSSTPPSVFHPSPLQKVFGGGARLIKRQSFGGSQNQGPNLPVPFLAFAISAIALFVIVVCFVLLRIIMRNRRLRRLGLLPEGPFDRLLGPTRETEDTLPPPKLLEARIAHDFRPGTNDAEIKTKGWDAVMPISAAVPPVLYSDLFPTSKTKGQENDPSNGGADGDGAQVGFSYPPTSTSTGGLARRIHVPAFLRRQGDDSQNDDTAGSGAHGVRSEAGVNATDGDTKPATADIATPASVNVTVLIAMPSPRTVFAPPQAQYNNATVRSQRSFHVDAVTSDKIDEIEESLGAQETRSGLRRTASIQSFRSAMSAKSVGGARREAFFHRMTSEVGKVPTTNLPTTKLDDDDDEELPELVFGTASVPIFTRIPGDNAAGRQPFAGTTEAYQPLRSELIRLVTQAHEARERKAAMEALAKQAEKDVANADDGQTTIDERLPNQGEAAGHPANGGVAADGRRVSASETIDSETAAIISAPGLANIPTSHQEGLGDVVSRMMMPEHTGSQHGTSIRTPVPASAIGGTLLQSSEDPRPSIGLTSILSRDETATPVPSDADAPTYNTSTLTLDPLLGDNARSYTGFHPHNAASAPRTS